jgi:hypothetical protein
MPKTFPISECRPNTSFFSTKACERRYLWSKRTQRTPSPSTFFRRPIAQAPSLLQNCYYLACRTPDHAPVPTKGHLVTTMVSQSRRPVPGRDFVGSQNRPPDASRISSAPRRVGPSYHLAMQPNRGASNSPRPDAAAWLENYARCKAGKGLTRWPHRRRVAGIPIRQGAPVQFGTSMARCGQLTLPGGRRHRPIGISPQRLRRPAMGRIRGAGYGRGWSAPSS